MSSNKKGDVFKTKDNRRAVVLGTKTHISGGGKSPITINTSSIGKIKK